MIESNSTWPIVSVVIPHYGGYETLLECISSLHNCDYSNLEIIVVDNCSQDKSAQLVKIEYPKIKLIESDYNRGFAGGCNYGAKFAKGEYLELKERYENFKDDMKAEGIEKYMESKVLNDTV